MELDQENWYGSKRQYEPKHEVNPNACPKGGVHEWVGTGEYPHQVEKLVCTKCNAIGWD